MKDPPQLSQSPPSPSADSTTPYLSPSCLRITSTSETHMAKASLSRTQALASPLHASTRGCAATHDSRWTGIPPANKAPAASFSPSTMNSPSRHHLRHHGEERTRIESATEQKQPVKREGIFTVLKIHGDVHEEAIDEPVPESVASCDNSRPILQPCRFLRFLGTWEHQRLHVH